MIATDSGKAFFPLTSDLIAEFNKQTPVRLEATMMLVDQLSLGIVMMPHHERMAAEVEAFFARAYPGHPPERRPLWSSYAFAFGYDNMRLNASRGRSKAYPIRRPCEGLQAAKSVRDRRVPRTRPRAPSLRNWYQGVSEHEPLEEPPTPAGALGCGSAWKRDPASGVIGVEKGPSSRWSRLRAWRMSGGEIGMLVLETVLKIRREFAAGKAMKAIARDLHLSRKVVRKAIREPEADFTYRRVVQPLPKLGPFQARLDALLDEDEARPRREKLRVTRIHDLLLREGFDGSYDAVRRYAALWIGVEKGPR